MTRQPTEHFLSRPPLLSVVIPTRNEKLNIASCIASFSDAQCEGWCEVIVVDNFSDDATAMIATDMQAHVFQTGPERSAQRNLGWRVARGAYILFVDADMIIPQATLDEIRMRLTGPTAPDALYIREIRIGTGWWIRVRNFERSFYDMTCIDGLRIIKRSLLETTGGYDEALFSCEDWDLDRRVLALTDRVALTSGHLLHNEQHLTLLRHLKKKRYYSGSFVAYIGKWGQDAITRKQFGLFYRFLFVFFENGKWRAALRHPVFLLAIWAERFCIGLIFMLSRKSVNRTTPGVSI